MALPFYNWSRTAASNATADSTVNWQEGQAPSSVNDSGRAMMASTAAFRDDIAGAIATGGTSTAYTVASYQVFSSLATMANQMIAFTPHATNGATVTLNVDGLGAKPLRSSPSVELLAGTLIQGTPYVALYNNSDAVWYLQNFFGNAYNVPLGGGMLFFGTTAPNSSFVFPYGQAISRTTYSTLFSMFSTTYGSGDGSTTFNVPDLRGRVPAGKDDMGGSSANRLTNQSGGLNGDTLGATGGAETHTLTSGEMPSHTHSANVTDPGHNHSTTGQSTASSGSIFATAASGSPNSLTIGSAATGITVSNSNTGGGNPHNNIQPTIVCNYIIRII